MVKSLRDCNLTRYRAQDYHVEGSCLLFWGGSVFDVVLIGTEPAEKLVQLHPAGHHLQLTAQTRPGLSARRLSIRR